MAPSAYSSAEAGPSNWNKASSEAASSRHPRHPRSQSFDPTLDPADSYPPAQPRTPTLRVRFSDESAGPPMARASEASSSVSPRTRPLDPAGSNPPAINLPPPILKVRFSDESVAAARDRASSEPFNSSQARLNSPSSSPWTTRTSSEPFYDTSTFPHHLRVISAIPTEGDPPKVESPPARKFGISVSGALAKIAAQRTSAGKKSVRKSEEVESPDFEVEEEEELPSFIIVNGTRLFVDKNRHDKARERKPSGGSSSTSLATRLPERSSTRSSADRKGKGKTNHSRRPSSATFNSKSSTPSLIKPTNSLITVNEMEKHPCTPGDYATYRNRDEDDLRNLYVAMRKKGFNLPYAPFEPEYVAMKYYTSKPQSCIPQLSILGFFVCWWVAIGGILSYRVWGVHVGYSKEWHWASIHQDLRFDDREWKLYVGSAGMLIVSFGGVTATCLWIAEGWWRDLITLGVFKVCQIFKQLGKKVNFRGRSGEALGGSNMEDGRGESEKKSEGRCRWEWDLDWEEKMVYAYRKWIWRSVMLGFMLLPLALGAAYVAMLLEKDKCFAHDKTGGFGW